MDGNARRSLGAVALMALAMPCIGQVRPGDPLPSPVYYPGEDGVSAPRLIHSVAAAYSEEARRAKFRGICLVKLIVDEHGMPRNVHELRPIGMGLDKSAIEAVKQERFEPGTYYGKPVAVTFSVEVQFDNPE
jgi:periplasmic protein TonB